MTQVTASELLTRLRHMDADTQDALTRFYLRLLKEETWSYQLRKENLLLKEQSQEAYRKKLNKFVKLGFLSKGKRYYVDGKPRNPFKPNPDVIKCLVERYSFAPYECFAAMETFKYLIKDEKWLRTLDSKLDSKDRLGFFETIFPLVFMGREISRFFFKLLFISAAKSDSVEKRYEKVHGLLMEMLSDIELDIAHDGIDHVGKRLFLDVHVKDIMMLLYALGASEKHIDTMKIAILEDLTVPLLTPIKYPNCLKGKYESFAKMSPDKRYDVIIGHILSVSDHFVKDFYGDDWERELSAYIAYAITSSINNPRDDIKKLLKHLQTDYGVTRQVVETVAIDIQRKIDRHDARNSPLFP